MDLKVWNGLVPFPKNLWTSAKKCSGETWIKCKHTHLLSLQTVFLVKALEQLSLHRDRRSKELLLNKLSCALLEMGCPAPLVN